MQKVREALEGVIALFAGAIVSCPDAPMRDFWQCDEVKACTEALAILPQGVCEVSLDDALNMLSRVCNTISWPTPKANQKAIVDDARALLTRANKGSKP
jgi:hypothetical protein